MNFKVIELLLTRTEFSISIACVLMLKIMLQKSSKMFINYSSITHHIYITKYIYIKKSDFTTELHPHINFYRVGKGVYLTVVAKVHA